MGEALGSIAGTLKKTSINIINNQHKEVMKDSHIDLTVNPPQVYM